MILSKQQEPTFKAILMAISSSSIQLCLVTGSFSNTCSLILLETLFSCTKLRFPRHETSCSCITFVSQSSCFLLRQCCLCQCPGTFPGCLRLGLSWFNWWVSFAPEFQCCYFCESSCLFYLSFNFDFYVSKIMHL